MAASAALKHSDLQLLLQWRGDGAFDLSILFNAPGDTEDYQYFAPDPVTFDLTALAEHAGDATAYGAELGRMLYGQGAGTYLDRAVRLAREMPVYVRLAIDDNAPPGYQAIRWEALRDPTTGDRLCTVENIRFSRYVSNPDGTPPTPLKLRDQLSALVVVANPAGIEGHHDGLAQLTPLDVDDEVKRAKDALANMAVRVLVGEDTAEGEEPRRATANRILEAMREQETNALYLVCHGMLDDGGPVIFLENDRGNVERVDGAAFAERVRDLGQRVPTLAALVSCQSAGQDPAAGTAPEGLVESRTALTAFGPLLSRAGCSVVVAMQGNVAVDTAASFLPRFFKELDKDGIAARAMSVARAVISEVPDWYAPVLYSRLKRGSAWYLPRFGTETEGRFRALHSRIAEKGCTPIVGSGLAAEDGILPTREGLAEGWAERRQVPVVGDARADLASVARYVAVDSRERGVARAEMSQFLRHWMKTRHAAQHPGVDWQTPDLHDLIRTVGREVRQQANGEDCYSRLARLQLPVFVTSSWTSLLEDALVDAGKKPVSTHFEWYRSLPSEPPENVGFEPQRPLVYHLFGSLEKSISLVLTEDDYFTWLRAWVKQVDKGSAIPGYVKPPLTENSLLFVGFTFDDWEFRMIFQAIKSFEGRLHGESRHIGVQFEPGTLRVEPEAAQDYLESYLDADELDPYWGRSAEFLRELDETRPPDD
ncbi:SIR2 family protein [Nocardioides mangrovi]|uniref:SIR2 family protein n=1 Tax=Nocardioides mangrovi TaxID=2874580 RepID=A0ABS7UHD6_9ACTN|nr:SIR2 family protein [Nocardioides mangrovi]MBZ5740287.1 SIR2 family protein [Nocardioides mangrovi]